MDDTQLLLRRIEVLAEDTDTSLSTLSGKLFGSGIRYAEIKAGGSLTMAVFARARERLAELERDAATKKKAAA